MRRLPPRSTAAPGGAGTKGRGIDHPPSPAPCRSDLVPRVSGFADRNGFPLPAPAFASTCFRGHKLRGACPRGCKRGNDVISARHVAFTLTVIPRHPRESGEKTGIHRLIQGILNPETRAVRHVENSMNGIPNPALPGQDDGCRLPRERRVPPGHGRLARLALPRTFGPWAAGHPRPPGRAAPGNGPDLPWPRTLVSRFRPCRAGIRNEWRRR